MGLLVTMFLSLTTLLVSSIMQSPKVARGVTALTAWLLIHYFFIVSAMVGYSIQLSIIRFKDKEELIKTNLAVVIDKWLIAIFSFAYLLINLVYWPYYLG